MAEQAKNPFDVLNDVGCSNEQVRAALELLSEELHDEMEIAQDKNDLAVRDRLYRLWLTLMLIIKQHEAVDRQFHDAEQALYDAGVQRQFQAAA